MSSMSTGAGRPRARRRPWTTSTCPPTRSAARRERVNVSTERLLELYRTMVTIRRFEETVSSLFARGRMPGFTHSYIGMEAVAAGVCVGLRPTDGVTSTHRGHGHAIAKGLDLDGLMAGLFG